MGTRVRAVQPLPALVVPRGAKVKMTPLAPASAAMSGIRSLSKAQVVEVAKTLRPITVALPWATLSARRPYVKDKAEATFWRVGHVSGGGDEVNLASAWAHPEARVNVFLPRIKPGQLFVVVVSGSCNGSGVLRYTTDAGAGDLPVTQGSYSFPIAVTDTDDDAYLELKVKTAPTLLTVRRIEIWEVK